MTTMNIYDMADTWNAGGTTFTAIKMNVTDTASAAGSLLLDLQVGGTSRFSVSKQCHVNIRGTDPQIRLGYLNESQFIINQGILVAGSTYAMGWSSSSIGVTNTNADLTLFRDAADTLAQRRGTNAQAFRLYETFTDVSNYSRLEVIFDAGNALFGLNATKLGTGVQRGLGFLTGGNLRWSIGATTGHFLAGADNTYDIGANGANRPRTGYFSNVIVAANGYFAGALNNAIKLNSSGTDGVGRLTNASDTDFSRLQFGGTTSSFPSLKRSSADLHVRLADDSAYAKLVSAEVSSTAAVKAHVATAIAAGGTEAFTVSSTGGFGVFFGSGAPTVSAAKGSLYLRSDGSTTNDRMYVNTDGSTTWTAVTTAA